MRTRYDYFGLFAFVVIVSVTVDKLEDVWTDQHPDPKLVVKFMDEGARNTSEQGKALCERINLIEQLMHIKQQDCKAIYSK